MADEYISRETAVKIAEKYGLANGSVLGRHTGLADCIASEISALPAADVAEVVRCKYCKMWGEQNIFEHSATGGMRRGGYCSCSRFVRYEDEFCSSGDYKTNTAENQPTPSGKKVALFDLGEVWKSMEGNR